MDLLESVKRVLRDTLQLGDRATSLTLESRLLGGIPEFDSMAVVNVLTMLEEEFDVHFDDDEVSAEAFESVGSLVAFVSSKVGQ